MNSVTHATVYPVSCPLCRTITARRAAEILHHPVVSCRSCATSIRLNENQLNRLRRTLADMADCQRRSASMLPTPPATEAAGSEEPEQTSPQPLNGK